MKGLLAAVLLLSAPAQAIEPDALFRALGDELARTTTRLEMEGLGKPYFASYTAQDVRRLNIQSSFGGLKDPHETRRRSLKVDLRVGNRAFDNTHYAGKDYWEYKPLNGTLPNEDEYDALRFGVWMISDRAYKLALERLSQKKAYKQNRLIVDEFPDLSEEPVRSAQTKPAEFAFEREAWEKRLRKLSAVFKGFPAIQNSSVDLFWSQTDTYFLDSEGRRILKADHDFELQMAARTQAPDGMALRRERRFIRQKLDDMPPFSLLETEALSLAEELTALAGAPAVAEPYIGPVLIEGAAAGEFFNQLLARNISYPREIWVEEDYAKKEFHSGALTSRLGLRVVSPFLSVEDDPTLTRFEGIPLIGHYEFDEEGVAARRVRLIEGGTLKDLLMSRAPVKERGHSTGHARAPLWEHPSARISTLVIEAGRAAPLPEMKRDLLARAKEFGLKRAYIVRAIASEEYRPKDELLAPPTLLFEADVETGRERLVRGAQFTGVTLRALRDIASASAERHVYNFYQLGPDYGPGRGQTQASIIHPSILVSELELKKTEEKPDKLPYLKHPSFN